MYDYVDSFFREDFLSNVIYWLEYTTVTQNISDLQGQLRKSQLLRMFFVFNNIMKSDGYQMDFMELRFCIFF